MTANLDGETNLKTRHSAEVTKGRIGSAAEAAGFVGFAECELPNPKLDAFVGRMTRMKPVEGRLRAVDKCALGQGGDKSTEHQQPFQQMVDPIFTLVCDSFGSQFNYSIKESFDLPIMLYKTP